MEEMPPYDWVIFDVGGVVVPEAGAVIEREGARLAGVDYRRWAEALREPFQRTTSGEISLLQMYAIALAAVGSGADAQSLLDLHLAVYNEHSDERVPGILDLIARLRRRYRAACLTNTEPEIAHLNRQRGLFDPFERAYLSTEMGMRKPHPEIWLAVLRDLGCPAPRALYVDDKQEYVDAARALTMTALLFTTADDLERELRPLLGDF
jgi:HAD superfamily hydrolase (TIGR01509 family)